MGGYPRWTADDEAALREGWGCYGGLPALASRLGRSVQAVKIRGVRLGLGPWLDAGEAVTLCRLIMIVTGQPASIGYSYTEKRWRRLGLRVFRRRVDGAMWKMVNIGKFWRWAEANRGKLDFSRFEENALGKEPAWAKAKRKEDALNRSLLHEKNNRAWSVEEVAALRQMVEGGAGYAELSRALRRSTGAIRRKIHDLKLPKPKRAAEVPWTDGDLRRLTEMIGRGVSIERCAREMDRSPEAVRGKLEWMRKKGMM